VTIQYLPVGGGPHGAHILNRHRFETISFKTNFFLKDYTPEYTPEYNDFILRPSGQIGG